MQHAQVLTLFLQGIVSALRRTRRVNPVVRSLGTCDFIVSNRMGVERKSHSGEFFLWFELEYIMCVLTQF